MDRSEYDVTSVVASVCSDLEVNATHFQLVGSRLIPAVIASNHSESTLIIHMAV